MARKYTDEDEETPMLELGELLERKGPGGTDGAGRRDGVSRGVGPGLRARRLLLVGAVVLVVVALLQLSVYALEPTIGTLRFYVKLAGTSSEQYCPDYLPLVRETLAPYRNGTAAASADEAVLQAVAYLKERCTAVRLRSGSVDYPGRPETDKRRHQDLRANIEMAQTLFGRLPDLDLWFNPSDAPALPKELHPPGHALLPPLGYLTTPRHVDVSIPYMRLEVWSEQEAVRTLDLLVDSHRWKDKTNLAVWRGSTTGQPEPTLDNCMSLPRARLANMSVHHPDLLDARLTSCKQCHARVKERYEALGLGWGSFLSYEDMFDYRMLVDVDGNSWSSRFPQLLSINSATFKQETENLEWFRPLLVPMEHYVPVKEDLSDLVEQLQHLSQHGQGQLEAIARRSTEFYKRLLLPSKQLCYLHLLLKEYASVLQARASVPQRRHGLSLRQ